MKSRAEADQREENHRQGDGRSTHSSQCGNHHPDEQRKHETKSDDDRVALDKGARRVGALQPAVREAQRERVHQAQRSSVSIGIGHAPGGQCLARKHAAAVELKWVAKQLADDQRAYYEQRLLRLSEVRGGGREGGA